MENIVLFVVIFGSLEWTICSAQQSTTTDPSFVGGDIQYIAAQEGVSEELNCTVNPTKFQINLAWSRRGNINLRSLGIKEYRDDENTNTRLLVIPKANISHTGIYICTVQYSNRMEKLKIFNVTITTKATESGSGAIIGGISMTIVVVTLLIVWIFFEFFKGTKNGLTKEEIQDFLLGNSEGIRNNAYAHENAAYLPYNSSYEIPQNKLYVDKRDVLGSGAFGQVLKGKVNNQTVAVKTLKPGADKMYLKSLLMELKIMIFLGRHSNIVNLVGAATQKLAIGSVYIIVECCEFGNMEKYIRDYRSKYVDQIDSFGNLILGTDNVDNELCTRDLINWSYQIANGMEFLGSKKVIHGDLAIRNVLIADRNTAKITDFGLSRQLYDYTTNYVKQNMEPLPWRWMAYESLRELSFSCNSDIWSYAVTLWEIYTLGEVPYPGLSWTNDFVNSLQSNYRLRKPKHATTDMYHEMINCWNIEPGNRPSFTHLKQFFFGLLDTCASPYELLHDID